ncbi:MAG: copper homeostasis protein CutC [Verrucomicrobia bacterium]|nr:copper homeostasis protein CutC [Cytophagales bacterium]
MLLEIIATSVYDAFKAENAGANRIELVENLEAGGITPDYGTIILTKKYLKIPVFPMVRPRGGDFVYADDEFELMCADIEICKKAGCDGVVFGLLTRDNQVDTVRCKTLVALARPMEVTFHRAFDVVANAFESLEAIIELGFDRILTSGQANTAWEGRDLIADLIKKAGKRIVIMPGSGIRETNIADLAAITQASEFHSSGRNKGEDFVNENMVKRMTALMK